MVSTAIRTATVALLLCAHAMFEPASPAQVNDGAQLDYRIGLPSARMYEDIRDSREWKNPFLIIRADGIQVIGGGISSARRIVSSSELKRTLIELPITAWPYGKVVAVQEVGIRSADGTDDPLIASILDATRAILEAMGVTMERWPN